MSGPARVVLLGPQRSEPNLGEVVRDLGLGGPLALVSAGWEERELEDAELRDHVGVEVRNLRVFERAENVYREDAELHRAMQERHDTFRGLQELYRLRLAHALEAARELLRREEDSAFLEAERSSAIDAVRELDAHHLGCIAEVHAAFEDRWRPHERDSVARRRRELAAELADATALCVAGGHVTILLNRLRLLDPLPFVGERPVIAWSAGAMVLAERIVLFHDSPPQGPGDAELFERGMRVHSGLVALPHAARRLRLDDPARVALFARRFAPAICAVLVAGSRFDWRAGRWSAPSGTTRLAESGLVEEASVA